MRRQYELKRKAITQSGPLRGRNKRWEGRKKPRRHRLYTLLPCEHEGHENLPVWFRSLGFLFRCQVRSVNVPPKQPSFPLMFTLFSTFSSVVYILIKFDIFCVSEVISSVLHSGNTSSRANYCASEPPRLQMTGNHSYDAEHVQVVHFQICLFLCHS